MIKKILLFLSILTLAGCSQVKEKELVLMDVKFVFQTNSYLKIMLQEVHTKVAHEFESPFCSNSPKYLLDTRVEVLVLQMENPFKSSTYRVVKPCL